MTDKINKLLSGTAALLIFGLLSGIAYTAVLYELFVRNISGGGLILFFFCPAVVCGAALVIIKTVKQCRENEEYAKISALFWIHVVLIVIAACIMAASFI